MCWFKIVLFIFIVDLFRFLYFGNLDEKHVAIAFIFHNIYAVFAWNQGEVWNKVLSKYN